MASSIFPLYQSHYRIRTYIAACLEERASKSSALAYTSQCAAFELAFCYTLGFGVNKDDARASTLLVQAHRSQEELTNEINRVRHGKRRAHARQSVYIQSLYRGHTITKSLGGDRYYCKKGTMDEAAFHIRKEIENFGDVVGAYHRIVRSLKSTLTNVLTLQGRWEEAQEVATQVLQCSSETLGERHPDTMTSRSSLAVILTKQKHWKKAELLHKQAMTASLTELPLDHGVTLSSMNSLAVMFVSQGRWDEAERLEKHVLQNSYDALGSEHPSSLDSVEHLADFKKEQDLWEKRETKAVQVIMKRSRSNEGIS